MTQISFNYIIIITYRLVFLCDSKIREINGVIRYLNSSIYVIIFGQNCLEKRFDLPQSFANKNCMNDTGAVVKIVLCKDLTLQKYPYLIYCSYKKNLNIT